MITRIDWLSFTLKTDGYEGIQWSSWDDMLAHIIRAEVGEGSEFMHFEENWELGAGRTPYAHSYRRHDNGISIFFHPNLKHFLIEVTGRGCERIMSEGGEKTFLEGVRSRLTRIDVATDILCDVSPLEFSAQREEGRFKSHSEFVSESGTTCYIGSRTSDRYARVYRYNAPHERSHLLRVEVVVKAENAKRCADAILTDGLDAVTVNFGLAFGWKHPVWAPDDIHPAELRMWRPERHEGKTLFWLSKTIAPLLVRLHAEGSLDAGQWFRENVERFIDGNHE